MMKAGHANPDNMLIRKNYIYSIEKVTPEKTGQMDEILEERSVKLDREHPFQQSPDFVKSLNEILSSREFKNIFNLN